MKIKVDFDLCEANAQCQANAPAYFEVDDDDYLHVLNEDVAEADLPAVRRAVAACPRSAISLVDDAAGAAEDDA